MAGYNLLSKWKYSTAPKSKFQLQRLGVAVAVKSKKVKNKPLASQYFVVGLSLIFTAYLLYAVSALNNSPSKGQFWFSTAGVAGLVCFALALAYRLDAMEKASTTARQKLVEQLQEKEGITNIRNAVLERKAAESTGELERQAREIERQAREIKRQGREIARINHLLQAYMNRPEPEEQPEKPEVDRPVPYTPSTPVPVTPPGQQHLSFEAFQKIYPDEETCLRLLDELKWGKGFTCRKCGCPNCTKGKKPYTRRCMQCRYPESAISFTLFGNLKFPIVKAFYMTYLVSSGKAVTIDELSETLSLRRQTCWAFKRKVKVIMQSRRHLQKPDDGWSHLVLNVEEVVSE